MFARHTPARRPGKVMFVSLFAVLTLLILAGLILNISRATARKLEAQAAADATALAGGTTAARSMNTLVAVQHLIGEIQAIDVMAYSFGGIPLEENDPVSLPDRGLSFAYRLAVVLSGGRPSDERSLARGSGGGGFPKPFGREIVETGESASGAAILDARKRLREMLTLVYYVHAAAAILEYGIGSTVGKGGAARRLAGHCQELEKNILFEWRTLAKLERRAKRTWIPLKQLGNARLIPGLHKYTRELVDETPRLAEAAAAAVADRQQATGTLFPTVAGSGGTPLELPVVREKQLAPRGWQRSQMVRASAPWVQFWRKPILRFGKDVLPISGFAAAYWKWSDFFTLHMARWQGEDYDTYLYVLKDLDYHGPDKGQEKWARRDGGDRADELFAVLGFARRPAPGVVGYPLFRDPQPDGVVGFAQVLLYNANPQDPKPLPDWQPLVGWDTLGWDGPVPELAYSEKRMRGPEVPEPRIRLNWQAKLVPATRLKDAAGSQPTAVDNIVRRTVADRPIANLH